MKRSTTCSRPSPRRCRARRPEWRSRSPEPSSKVSAALTAARTRKELMKALLIERARVEAAREAAAPSIAGPIIVALLFASAAGAMLPGSDGFAASHFQLNTGLILFLGYGWMFLVLWAVLALAMLTARSSPDGQKMVRSGK